jgi:hypothetical protein
MWSKAIKNKGHLKLGLSDRWISGFRFGPGQCMHVYMQQWIFIFIYKWKQIKIIITIFDWNQYLIGYDVSLFFILKLYIAYIRTFIDRILAFTSCLSQLQ